MLSTVDQGIFQTQECNSTRLTRVLRLRKNQQWVIEGFTFFHWHQCTGFLLHHWPLKGAHWGWAMSVSHTHWLWMPHIWASPAIKPLWWQRPLGTPQRLSEHIAAMDLVYKCPSRVLSNTCLFTELEERQYWSGNSFGDSLQGQSRWNQLAKVKGCLHHCWLHPQAELGDSFPLIYWAIIVCLFSLKTAPLVSCPNHHFAHLHRLVHLYSQNL